MQADGNAYIIVLLWVLNELVSAKYLDGVWYSVKHYTCYCWSLFFHLVFNWRKMLYNVLVSAIQQCESIIIMYMSPPL